MSSGNWYGKINYFELNFSNVAITHKEEGGTKSFSRADPIFNNLDYNNTIMYGFKEYDQYYNYASFYIKALTPIICFSTYFTYQNTYDFWPYEMLVENINSYKCQNLSSVSPSGVFIWITK